MKLLFKHRFYVLMVAIRHNRVVQRILPCLLVEFWIYITIITAKNRAKEVVSVIKCVNKGNGIRSNLGNIKHIIRIMNKLMTS